MGVSFAGSVGSGSRGSLGPRFFPGGGYHSEQGTRSWSPQTFQSGAGRQRVSEYADALESSEGYGEDKSRISLSGNMVF